MNIGIIGATGRLGSGLALQLVKAGYCVLVGSRSEKRAQEASSRICSCITGAKVSGLDNLKTASDADVIILAIPFSSLEQTLSSLDVAVRGKIVLDTTVPLVFDNNNIPSYLTPLEGSAAQKVRHLLPDARIVSGLHTISAGLLADIESELDCDALICGDDLDAKEEITKIIQCIGIRVFDSGPLRNAQTLERLVPLIIGLNKKYKRRYIGLKLSGI